MRRISLVLAVLALAAGISAAPRHLESHVTTGSDFVHFESAHVHPEAMTPDGNLLLVVNTPDNRLSVFSLTGPSPTRIAEIPVGLEPVSVAAFDNGTAWVVNNVSDDVSIVDLTTMHVRATLRTGDEPNDVVFAGSPTRAYVSVSSEDAIKVYDPSSLALVTSIPVNGRMPRALSRNAAGTLVFTSIFEVGNRTSVVPAATVNGSIPPDPNFPRNTGNKTGHPDYPSQPAPAPAVGAVVQYFNGGSNGAGWYDEYGGFWSPSLPYTISKVDVAEINTGSNTVSRNFTFLQGSGVSSTVFNVATSPANGRLAVVGLGARNPLRFEPKIRGYTVETQLNFVSTSGTVALRILNPHITYFDVNGFVTNPGTQTERDSAIATPTGVAWSADGSRVYVSSLGTNKLAVIDPLAGSAGAAMKARVPTVEGPTGVLVDDARARIYVVGRDHNQLQTLSTATGFAQLALTGIGFDPTPDDIVNGRKFFYGGQTSSHGDQSCASCHIFGDTDNLAWDLGDPSAAFTPPPDPNPLGLEGFDPQKGPMITQSLRGLTATEPLHWRGDRTDLSAFNPAFISLLGRTTALPDSERGAFNAFVMPLTYPPNPNQFLNDSLRDAAPGSPSAERGRVFFMNATVNGTKCVDCHAIPSGTDRVMIPDQQVLEDQDLKVPQLRNLYKMTGFTNAAGASKHGTAFAHDGTADNLYDFLFNAGSLGPHAVNVNNDRRDLEAYLLSFDTGTAPAIGFQVTFDGTPNPTGVSQVDTLKTVYANGRCDIVAKGRVGGQPRGWLYVGGDQWASDKSAETDKTTTQLLALATDAASAITVTGVPQGSGTRIGIDRDRDLYRDGDELDDGSDPGDPASTPHVTGVPHGGGSVYALEMIKPNPTRGPIDVVFTLARAGRVDIDVYDLLGRQTRVVARGTWFEAGRSSVTWDGKRGDGRLAGTGVYFVRVRTEGGEWTRPILMAR